MIKNKLYPYIEKYINEYLWGFSKEQMEVGVISGTIALDTLNIRADQLNLLLDTQELPFWIKAGRIGKISISCSLMNFIGEKPLDAVVEDIDLIVAPSLKWILRNIAAYVVETEDKIQSPYDPLENNSRNPFGTNVNIYDSSFLKKKETIIKYFSDGTKISEVINKIFTKCMKFYYQKTYFINAKVKNIHIRFEDDQVINVDSSVAFGLTVGSLEVNLSAEGNMKKNGFKCDNVSVYWEHDPMILIPYNKYIQCLDKENTLDPKYYDLLSKVNFRSYERQNVCTVLNNFNFMGNFGIQVVDSGNLDFFANNREKKYNLYFQIATSELIISTYPELLSIGEKLFTYVKSFSLIEDLQIFKPMRKPYNSESQLLKKYQSDQQIAVKRKMVVRDWLHYMIWFKRFKNARSGANKNILHKEFSRYYNICCVPSDLPGRKEKEKGITDNEESKGAAVSTENNLNAENITLGIVGEVLIKGITVQIYASSKREEYVVLKLNGLEYKTVLEKDKFEIAANLRHVLIQSSNAIYMDGSIIQVSKMPINDDQGLSFSQTIFNENTMTPDSSQKASPGGSNLFQFSNPKASKKIEILEQTLSTLTKNINQPASSNSPYVIMKTNRTTNNSNSNSNTITNHQQKISCLFDDIHSLPSNATFTNDNSLSTAINEYNLKRGKPSVTSKIPRNEVKMKVQLSTQPDKSDKVQVPMMEVAGGNAAAIMLKYSKCRDSTDTVKIFFGTIRVNVIEEYVLLCVKILFAYPFFKKVKVINEKEVAQHLIMKLKCQKQRYLMKNYMAKKFEVYNGLQSKPIINAMANPVSISLTQSLLPLSQDIIDFFSLLNSEIAAFPAPCDTQNFEVNYIFNFLTQKGFHAECNHKSFEVRYCKTSQTETKLVGTAKIPPIDLKLLLSLKKLLFKCFDFEMEYNDLNNCRIMLTNLWAIIEEKFKCCTWFIQPVLKRLREEIIEPNIFALKTKRDNSFFPPENISNTNKIVMNNIFSQQDPNQNHNITGSNRVQNGSNDTSWLENNALIEGPPENVEMLPNDRKEKEKRRIDSEGFEHDEISINEEESSLNKQKKGENVKSIKSFTKTNP